MQCSAYSELQANPGTLGIRRGYTLEGMSDHCTKNTHIYIRNHLADPPTGMFWEAGGNRRKKLCRHGDNIANTQCMCVCMCGALTPDLLGHSQFSHYKEIIVTIIVHGNRTYSTEVWNIEIWLRNTCASRFSKHSNMPDSEQCQLAERGRLAPPVF